MVLNKVTMNENHKHLIISFYIVVNNINIGINNILNIVDMNLNTLPSFSFIFSSK